MPKQSLALYLQGDPVFQITPSSSNERYSIIVSYENRDILQSGWLVGEGNITGKAAMISADVGKGKVILIGFRAQHRAQTYGTLQTSSSTVSRTKTDLPFNHHTGWPILHNSIVKGGLPSRTAQSWN